MYDISGTCRSVPLVPIHGTDQDDSSGPPTYLQTRSSRGPSSCRDAPLDTHRNRAYFICIDSRGREFEIVLAADDRDDDLWHAIHALQTHYRKNC
jgi:hypothetical protein